MDNCGFSKKIKIKLLFLLFLLNLIIRIPSIPHEKGIDSFFIHSLANSISLFGERYCESLSRNFVIFACASDNSDVPTPFL